MVRITRAIVHEIPKGRYDADGDTQVALSDAVSNLAVETRRFIEDNMLNFALKNPRDIQEDLDSSSATPGVIRSILSDPDANFVAGSQALAKALHQAQTGNSPSGILIVAVAESVGNQSIVVLKAEHQEGMRLQRVGGDGAVHFDLEHLNELIVGNNSRVYKIGVLRLHDGLLRGQMVDQQNGVAFADFFMTTFLGCRLSDSSEIQTKQFMDSAMNFVNSEISDEQKQGRYATALVAYMSSPAPTFQAAEFADQFLEIEDRDSFIRALPDQVSSSVISKNLTLVPGHGAGLRLYGAGVLVAASASALDRGAVRVSEGENGETMIVVSGSLKRYSLGSPPKD